MTQNSKGSKRNFIAGVFGSQTNLRDEFSLEENTLPEEIETSGHFRNVALIRGRPIDTKLLVQELQKPHSLDTYIKLVEELCDMVTKYTFSDITEVWACVKKLLSSDMPTDARNTAFKFMISCIKGHFDNLGFLRVIFYDCIKFHDVSEDFNIRLLALKELCQDGRNISSFEKNLVKLLSEWPHSLDTYIKLVEELCDMVTKYTFSDITEVWACVKKLLSSDMPTDARNTAFKFMISCIKGHFDNLGFLRVIFYDCIKFHDVSEDFNIRLLALKELCQDGRNISSFEKNLVKLLSEWVNQTVQIMDQQAINFEPISTKLQTKTSTSSSTAEESSSSSSDVTLDHFNTTRLQSVVSLLVNVVKFNFPQFEEHDIAHLIEDIAKACKKSLHNSDIECCLSFWDVIVPYGFVPISSLKSYVEVLCDKLNQDVKISQTCWRIMKNLLKSHCKYSTIKILCNNLENPAMSNYLQILTGSVQFLGWAIWGSNQNDLFLNNYSSAISAMRQATLTCKDAQVHCEILIQIRELITKFEEKIATLEWDIILNILDNTRYHLLKAKKFSVNTDISNISNDDSNQPSSIVNIYSRLIFQIQASHMSNSFKGSISHFISLIQSLHDYVSESTILMLLDYYNYEHELYPSSPNWLSMLDDVVKTFYIQNYSSIVRQKVLAMVIDVYDITKDFYYDQVIEIAILPMFARLPEETDLEVSNSTIAFLITVIKEVPDKWFPDLLKILVKCTNCVCVSENKQNTNKIKDRDHLDLCKSIISTDGLIMVFQHYLYNIDHISKLIKVYSEMMKILSDVGLLADSRFTLLSFFIRMRANSDRQIYFVEDLDVGNVVQALRRCDLVTNNTSNISEEPANSTEIKRKGSVKKRVGRRASLKDIASSIFDRKETTKQTATLEDNEEISGYQSPKVTKTLWKAPEVLRFILTAHQPSPYVLSFERISNLIDDDRNISNKESSDETLKNSNVILPVDMYLKCLIDILSQEKNWEIYSYILCYLPLQLCDKNLFYNSSKEILALRSCLCDWIINNRLAEKVSLPSDIKKMDVYVATYQMLIILISYNSLFNNNQRHELLLAFHTGLYKWTLTAKPCIHALNVCLYELPYYLKRSLPDILAQLSKIITTTTMSVHILEFLSSLARLPDLYVNFTEADYKIVFRIAMQYIGYSHRNSNTTNSINSNTGSHFSTTSNTHVPTTSPANSTNTNSSTSSQSVNSLSQYEKIMAYQVIYLWFISLKLPERRRYVNFIVHGLLIANESSQKIDEQTETCFDMLARYSFANCNPKPEQSFINQVLQDQGKDKFISRTWVQGNTFLTIRTLKLFGWADIIIRRPSGTVSFLCRLENHIKNENKDALSLPATLIAHYNPEYQNQTTLPNSIKNLIAQNVNLKINNSKGLSVFKDYPRPLPDDDSTIRTLTVLDNIPVVDFHKIGVLYVGKNQNKETEILSNIHGSQDYTKFLSSLGTLIKLKDCKNVYTGGLDTKYDTDGDYAYYWQDDITQVIFHCATLMPTNMIDDPQCNLKKRHIGNNYVTIVYNDSGDTYAFDTLPGHFNLINIVISPHSYQDLFESKMPSTSNHKLFYKVVMQRRSDMPEISPITEFKMISAVSLASFVREMALNANIFTQIFLKSRVGNRDAEYVSNWKGRLKQIKGVKERLSKKNSTTNVTGGNDRQQFDINYSIENNSLLESEYVFDFTQYT
ncbi:8958_t:CDS:2 [Entrophospora sp. SA101]|nr:8958_t:CDS:2 [Entrophospora sp. SA101]